MKRKTKRLRGKQIRVIRSIVPSLFTLANMLCGFIAIVYISDGRFFDGALFILAAGLFDTFDGIMARLTNSTSEFGVELDSLCDAISFGIAPSFMLYKSFFYVYGELGIFYAALPALAGIVRLARFNVQAVSFEDKNYFRGMPIPAGAIISISYIIYYMQSDIIPNDIKVILTFAVSILTALSMISTIKFDNLPRPNIRDIKKRPVIFSATLIAIIASIITKGMFIFPFMLLYIIASISRYVYYRIKTSREVEDEIDESEVAE